MAVTRSRVRVTRSTGPRKSAGLDRSRSVSLQAYEIIRQQIIANKLQPGQPLSEKELARMLNVSRTPAREALLWLAKEGLVEVFPRHGTFVSAVQVDQVFEAHTIREALEIRVVQAAAQRATARDAHTLESNVADQSAALACGDRTGFHRLDEEFHRALARIARLERASRLIDEVKTPLDRVRRLANEYGRQPEDAAREHRQILEAVVTNDSKAAAAAMQRHLDGSFEAIKRIIRARSDFFAPVRAGRE